MRILILEDDPLIALDLQSIVEDCGHEVAWMCDTIAEARQRISATLDFAFLDIDLPDGKSFELAAFLDAHRVPFAFVSASGIRDVPPALRHAPFIPKPYGRAAIRNSLPPAASIAC